MIIFASIEESRKTLLVRRTLDGSGRNVLHIRKDRILPDEADQTDQTDISTGKCDPEIGQVSENVKNRPAEKTDQIDQADYAEVHSNDSEMGTSVGLVSKQKHMPHPTDWGIAI
jgi:hypothetical protein